MPESLYQFGSRFFIWYLPLLFSLCVHEWAHARMALRKGDTLALHMGRLSLNPAVHIDWVGTVLLPLISIFTGLPVFGWAKPVPVNAHHLKNPVKDMFWIALAGPLSNLCLALLSAVLLIFFYSAGELFPITSIRILIAAAQVFVYLNLMLCFFNLIPLHPLDGGKVLARFLPPRWNYFLEQQQSYSSMVLIILFIGGGFHYLAVPLMWTANIMTASARITSALILQIF